ncbi:MAG: hypothetical protein EZS28_038777 [Streblomastix strix]|uniref:Uncharacterized protein n=1 Tax=Streblomastix strix TaxID=222440 RepID=A0A5J4U4K4_9EUKA|nr:MAG: hypothetical protein EZS28_038777 [Streblomastix strix]
MIKYERINDQIKNKGADELTEMAIDGLIENLCADLKQSKQQIEDKGGLIIRICKIAKQLLFQNEVVAEFLLEKDGFFEELFLIYKEILPEQVFKGFANILVTMIDSNSNELRLAMKQEKFVTPVVHFLQSKDEYVVIVVVLHLCFILIQMKETGDLQQKDEFLGIMQRNKGLDFLVQLINNPNIERKNIKKYAAIIICSLHKGETMQDEFRNIVIKTLKQNLGDDNNDKESVQFSALALARLAESEGNHADIVTDDFSAVLRKIISSTDPRTIDQGLILTLNLLHYGSDQVKEKVRDAVPWDEVREMMHNGDAKLKETAELLDQWMAIII